MEAIKFLHLNNRQRGGEKKNKHNVTFAYYRVQRREMCIGIIY